MLFPKLSLTSLFPSLASLLGQTKTLISKQTEVVKEELEQPEVVEDKGIGSENEVEDEKSTTENKPNVNYLHRQESDPAGYDEAHPFAPFDPSVYNNCDSSNPNWLPGLPKPPPGVTVAPPRDRSRKERLRYLADLER